MNHQRSLCKKNLDTTILFVDFSKAFDSIHREKMEQKLLTYVIPKETVTAMIMLYRNTKVKVCSPDRDTDFFDIVAGVLQGDTLALYLFIICLDYVLWMSINLIKKWLYTKKGKKQTISRRNYNEHWLNRRHRASCK